MNPINIKFSRVHVRRDAYTTTVVDVPPHEIPILRNIFGKENLLIEESDQEHPIHIQHEYDRLSSKYCYEIVSKVYGEDDGERLMEQIKQANLKEPVVQESKPKASKGS
jgi:hypothetical protein